MVRLRASRRFLMLMLTFRIADPVIAAAGALKPVGAQLEVGLGETAVRPLESQKAPGATVRAGLSVPLRGPWRVGLELATSSGADFGARIPESPTPGHRTLTTLLLGIEVSPRDHGSRRFAFLGVGLGHSTLSNAFGVFAPPYDRWFVPDRSLTALALGAGLGHRFAGGPGSLGFQLALRTQLIPHSGQIAASATMVTMGLAY